MKFSWKFMFQGPPQSSLQHLTALWELDSIKIGWFFIFSILSEICMARYMARISAQLISMGGIGEENIHLNFPSLLRRIPPMVDPDWDAITDASTIHFRWLIGGGSQCCMHTCGFMKFIAPVDSFHIKHDWFFNISSNEYGKGSFHPLIHHRSWSNAISRVSATDLEQLLKIMQFLSFQIVHIKMKNIATPTFLKNRPLFKNFHWSNASLRFEGKTHFKFHIESHDVQTAHENGQWSRVWL